MLFRRIKITESFEKEGRCFFFMLFVCVRFLYKKIKNSKTSPIASFTILVTKFKIYFLCV